MIKKIGFFTICILCFFNTQCDEDEVLKDDINPCDEVVVVSEPLYNDLTSADFQLISAVIEEDCLKIEFGASGCDGNTWAYNLIDSGAVAESLPEQRFLKFQLINEEDCAASFEKSISFNISSLQIEGSNEIILNIVNADTSITYSY